MILAEQTPVLAIVGGVAILIGLAVAGLFLFRGYEYLARRSLLRKYDNISLYTELQPGGVLLTYHTYHGFIVWFSQTPHQVVLSPTDARKLLGRLLRFNLTWGLVAGGAVFVPPLAIINYLAQRRSIAAQEARGGFQIAAMPAATTQCDRAVAPTATLISDSPSAFHRFVGWIAAVLGAMFAIGAVVSLVTGEFGGAIGCVIVSVLLGQVARDWLGKRQSETT